MSLSHGSTESSARDEFILATYNSPENGVAFDMYFVSRSRPRMPWRYERELGSGPVANSTAGEANVFAMLECTVA